MRETTAQGRRERRRQETIDEIVHAALTVMTGTGAAGLSLGEVAKRLGMRTPSLYAYFPSKAALCDEIFRRGWRDLDATMQRTSLGGVGRFDADGLHAMMADGVHWAIAHRAYGELMFWRPIPGWTPSDAAYASAVQAWNRLASSLRGAQEDGLLRGDADVVEMSEIWTVLFSGVVSQHLSNQPEASFEEGRHARLTARLVDLFLAWYGRKDKGEGKR